MRVHIATDHAGLELSHFLMQRLSEDAKGRADYQDFVRRCQLDPFTQIDSVFVALPE